MAEVELTGTIVQASNKDQQYVVIEVGEGVYLVPYADDWPAAAYLDAARLLDQIVKQQVVTKGKVHFADVKHL